MKLIIAAIVLCLISGQIAHAQIGENLVRNWSFEELKPNFLGDTICPSSVGNIHLAKFWKSAHGGPSYFNTCSNDTHPGFGVPINALGYQMAVNGQAYAAVGGYYTVWEDSRQFLFHELEEPLLMGNHYRLDFHVSLADSCNFAMSGMGALLSVENTRFWQKEDFLNSTPQVLNPWENLLDDKEGWTLISGTFTAQGGEKYLSIGFFRRDAEDNIQRVSEHPEGFYSWEVSGYYIDGVELYEDRGIGIDDPENKFVKLYPNPADAIITIETERGANDLEMFDMSGRSVLHSYLPSPKETIDISHFPQGVYVVAVTLRDGSVHRARLVKQ